MAFFAGANSIFYGDKLLTTSNPEASEDQQLFTRLGINSQQTNTPVGEEVHQAALQEALEANNSLYQDATRKKDEPVTKPCGLVV